jgi:hypothetical protein
MTDPFLRLILALLAALAPVAAPLPDTATGGTKFTATYCAPTPKYCRNWGGDAHLAAVRSFSYGDEPYWVRVTRVTDGHVNTTTVLVVSNCGCGSRRHGWPNIDVSPAAFRELGPLSAGVLEVRVERIDGVPTVLPATDTGGTP